MSDRRVPQAASRPIQMWWITAVALVFSILFGVTSPAASQSTEITIDPVGSFDRSGAATITGTVICGGAAGFGFVEAPLRQQVGRVSTVQGSASTDIFCYAGETISWTADVIPLNGKFRGGPASASARVFIEGPSVSAETSSSISLRR